MINASFHAHAMHFPLPHTKSYWDCLNLLEIPFSRKLIRYQLKQDNWEFSSRLLRCFCETWQLWKSPCSSRSEFKGEIYWVTEKIEGNRTAKTHQPLESSEWEPCLDHCHNMPSQAVTATITQNNNPMHFSYFGLEDSLQYTKLKQNHP